MEQVWITVIGMVWSVAFAGVQIDRGLVDGIQEGDPVEIYYILKVAGEDKRIEIAEGEVIRVEDAAAVVSVLDPSKVKPGYRVSIRIPEDRVAPTRLLEMAKVREEAGQLESALIFLKRLEESIPGDLLVQNRIQRIRIRQKEEAEHQEELKKVPFYQQAAREFLEQNDLESARSYVNRVLAVAPDDEVSRTLLTDIERIETDRLAAQIAEQQKRQEEAERQRQAALEEEKRKAELERQQESLENRQTEARLALLQGMLQVVSGVYEVGVKMDQAKAYNQTPRFKAKLGSYWIDTEIVSMAQFAAAGQSSPSDEPSKPALGISYDDAETYCREHGKRLPTEFEWEVAAVLDLIRTTSASEWTSSDYQPYPGNIVYEDAYGEQYRVLRGPEKQVRYFIDPSLTSEKIGFRCALTGEQ